MSTLNVANITDGTDTVETGYVVNGSAKAWVNFNGQGTVAVRDSMNVASLTDNGTGQQSVSLTNSMNSGNYAFALGGSGANATRNINLMVDQESAFPTATVLRFLTRNQNNADTDCIIVSCEWLGDLA